MTQKSGTVTVDADEYLKLLDELADLEKRLRDLGSEGFNVSGRTGLPSQASREKKDEPAAMELDVEETPRASAGRPAK